MRTSRPGFPYGKRTNFADIDPSTCLDGMQFIVEFGTSVNGQICR